MSKQKGISDSILVFPLKGFDIGGTLSALGQPPLTTSVCLNVWPYDANGRRCGAVRPKLSQPFFTSGTGDGVAQGAVAGPIIALGQTKILDSFGNRLDITLIVANDGLVWSIGPNSAEVLPPDAGTVDIQSRAAIAANATHIYFADLSADKLMVMSASSLPGSDYHTTVFAVTPSAGTIPPNCTIACFWRARLLLSGSTDGGSIVYASKVADPTNWDFAGDLDAANPGDAWSINIAASNQAGDPVTAMIPYSDDTLLVASKHTIYRFDGDPAGGGELTLVTSSGGISGPTAWCSDGSGTVYFVGDDGLYSVSQGSGVRPVSAGRMGEFWRQIVSEKVELNYDKIHNGIWIMDCLTVPGNPVVHLYYDIGLDGFFPIQFSATSGAATSLWSTSPQFEGLLLGGSHLDGMGLSLTRLLGTQGCGRADNENIEGQDEAITSKVLLGPLQPGGDFERSKITALIMIAGDSRILSHTIDTGDYADSLVNLNYTLYGGSDPLAVGALDSGLFSQTGAITSWGRQFPANHRMSANTFGILLSNTTINKTWSFERAILRHVPAGRNR